MTNNDTLLNSYNYSLPEELIAQKPSEQRDKSRLMIIHRNSGQIEHRLFEGILDFFNSGDCLVINSTRVVPARLFGKKETGGKVEILFLNPPSTDSGDTIFRALLRPYISPGKKIILPDDYTAMIVEKNQAGETVIELSKPGLFKILEKYGIMPLPPYIKRKDAQAIIHEADKSRYQTVYARKHGSIAAPTAGLHFTPQLLDALRNKGVKVIEIILHVGWGTFKPVYSQEIREHQMLPESYEVSSKDIEAITSCRAEGGKVFAVGTTSVRTLESVFADNTPSLSGETSLFIHPGYSFKVVDCFITNFHLPHSTPLFLACAFAGRETILAAYREAIKEKYRFYSYGDAMLIL